MTLAGSGRGERERSGGGPPSRSSVGDRGRVASASSTDHTPDVPQSTMQYIHIHHICIYIPLACTIYTCTMYSTCKYMYMYNHVICIHVHVHYAYTI